MDRVVQTLRLPGDLVRRLEAVRPQFGGASRAALLRLAADEFVRRHEKGEPR